MQGRASQTFEEDIKNVIQVMSQFLNQLCSYRIARGHSEHCLKQYTDVDVAFIVWWTNAIAQPYRQLVERMRQCSATSYSLTV